jgi:hypothetical protein
MKKINFFFIVFSFLQISYIQSAINGLMLGYINHKIIERTVPEFKEFNDKIYNHFLTKDNKQKELLKKEINDLGNTLIVKLKDRLANKDLTQSQKNTIQSVIKLVKHKLDKLNK